MTTESSSSHLRFQNQNKLVRRLTPRVIIYPIVILAIVYFMKRNQQLAQQSEPVEQVIPLVELDATKPAAFTAPENEAPVFPQLIFYHENNLSVPDIADKLHEKHAKTCIVVAVDLTKSPTLKQKYSDQKTPFAVLSKPDGTVITIQDPQNIEFFDELLGSLKK